MIVQRQNYLQYCIAILIGVVIQDLKYDFSEDKKYAASYYEGQWLQYNPIIDILIAFLSVTLIYEVFVNKTWKNYVVLILLLFSGICLALILIPLQLLVKIDQLEKDKDQFDYLETIKFYHIYVLLALLVALLFSVLASVPKDDERIKGEQVGKKYYSFSLTALYVCYIIGIMLIDLKNDMVTEFKFVKNYYIAQYYSNSIAQFMIIGLGFTLIREVVQSQNKTKYSYLILVVLAAAGYIFAYEISPQMKKFNLQITDDKVLIQSAQHIKEFHALMIILLFVCLGLIQLNGKQQNLPKTDTKPLKTQKQKQGIKNKKKNE